MMGQASLRNGDRAGAVQCWRKVIEMNPDHGEALYNLSRLLAQTDATEAKILQERFDTLQARRHIMDRAQTLGNFALSSAGAHDWPAGDLAVTRRIENLRRLQRVSPAA